MSDTGLPSGWEIGVSQSKNLPYYYNANLKQSLWTPPEGSNIDALRAYMETHYGHVNGAERIRCAHLLVKHKDVRRPASWKSSSITRTKEEAREIIEKFQQEISNGASLQKLATTESDCSSARKGGDLGFFAKGDMQPQFEKAAFALNVGEISGVVETASGLHLIQRLA